LSWWGFLYDNREKIPQFAGKKSLAEKNPPPPQYLSRKVRGCGIPPPLSKGGKN